MEKNLLTKWTCEDVGCKCEDHDLDYIQKDIELSTDKKALVSAVLREQLVSTKFSQR